MLIAKATAVVIHTASNANIVAIVIPTANTVVGNVRRLKNAKISLNIYCIQISSNLLNPNLPYFKSGLVTILAIVNILILPNSFNCLP